MKYKVVAEVEVEIDVSDANAIDRCVNNENDWRGHFYDLLTRDDVLIHWAWNACANGQTDVSRLEGWADLPRDAVRMAVDRLDFIQVDEADQ